MPTSQDVSERAGVSRATVSAVVNGTRYVSPELRARVEQAISDLSYQPNAVARSLKTSKTLSIGLIIPTLYSPFSAPLVSVIEQVLTDAGYSLILCSSYESEDRETAMLRVMAKKRIDGLLLIPVSLNSGTSVMEFVQRGIPIVFVDRRIPGLPIDTVTSDNFGAGYQATRHLLQSGCTRIGLITFGTGASSSSERLNGYRAALSEGGVTPDETLVAVVEDPKGEGAYYCAAQMLDLPRSPDGLVIAADRLVPAAIHALQDRGARIPQDVQVVAFDDSPWTLLLQPSLTVVDQSILEMGQKAAQLLLSRLQSNEERPPKEIILETRLIGRGSSGLHQGTC